MSEQVIYFSNNVRNYPVNVRKLIDDISAEMSKGVKDGLASRIASIENDEAKLYSFIKNEGYDISYKEFSGFIEDCKETIESNEQFINQIASEQRSEELSDSDLEQVAGGMSWWKKLLIGIGAVLVVAAVIFSAGLLAPVAIASGIAAEGIAVAATIGTALASSLAACGSGVIAAGVMAAAGAAALGTGLAVK